MNKNDFAKTPPMGWNSYDYYDTTVNEAQVRANAAFMAEHLREYGWEYVVVDIQWYAQKPGTRRQEFQYIPFSHLEMDEYSRLLPDPERFPSSAGGAGFGPLAEYVHSLGLKFGIHIMRGIPRLAAHLHGKIKGCAVTANEIADPTMICGWNSDMYGVRNRPEGQAYYDSLMELYAQWGVDYIKCDDICNLAMLPHKPYAARHEVEMIAKAIEKCGREIVLSLSPGPALLEQAWHYGKYANMWRITGDFWDDWSALKEMFWRCELWQDHVSQGCYPDCDMLPMGYVGKGFGQERKTNFTLEEQRTMMTLWCIFGAPLMLGAEMTLLEDDPETMSLLTNREVLGMLPPQCRPRQVVRDEDKAAWVAYNASEDRCYLAVFCLSDGGAQVQISRREVQQALEDVGMPGQLVLCGTELWSGETLEDRFDGDSLTFPLAAHGCKVYALSHTKDEQP